MFSINFLLNCWKVLHLSAMMLFTLFILMLSDTDIQHIKDTFAQTIPPKGKVLSYYFFHIYPT